MRKSLVAMLVSLAVLAGSVSLAAQAKPQPKKDPIDDMADTVLDSPLVKKYLEDQKKKQDEEKKKQEDAKKKPQKKKQISPKGGRVAESSSSAVMAGVDFNQGVAALGSSGNAVLAAAASFDAGFYDYGTSKNVLGGAMVFFQGNGTVTPFVQGMAGVQSCCGETDFEIHMGGGVDIDIQKSSWIRASVAVRRIFFSGGSVGDTVLSAGIVIPLN